MTDLAQELADLSVTLARSQTATLAEYPELPDVLREASDEIERLRAEVADLRLRLAAETGGEVEGWEWRDFPHKRWVLTDSLAGWNIKVYRSGSQWTWYVDGLVFEQDADGEAPTAFDAMRAAVAAYERLRGEEDGGDA